MKFEVIYSERALKDLRNIHRYIESELLTPEAAKRLSAKIMTTIDGLDEMPMRHALYDKEPWRGRGLRKLLIDNFIAFYLPVEKSGQVLILSIMYARRNTAEILQDIQSESEL